MNRIAIACLTSALLFGSCQTAGVPSPAPEPRDDAKREALLDAVRKLEGRWEMVGAPEAIIEFTTIANGTAVKEVMFPGAETEMVNMYTLEGNALMMTHYCSSGNQPVMRATELKDGTLAFESVRVQDLDSPDAHFMSDMTLIFEDENNVTEAWRGTTAGEVDEMPEFQLKRVR